MLKWDDAYAKAQASANTCIYSTARVENREKLFKWFGPIATNHWSLYAAPTFDKPIKVARDARFFKIGAVKNDAKVDFMRKEGASSIRESDKDADNPARLALPKTDPHAIDLWITAESTAKEMAAKAESRTSRRCSSCGSRICTWRATPHRQGERSRSSRPRRRNSRRRNRSLTDRAALSGPFRWRAGRCRRPAPGRSP